MSDQDRYGRGGNDRTGYGYERGRDYGYSGRNRQDYGPEGYGERRDWTDRAGDEVRSWFGDDDAERRRRMDEGYRGRDERSGYGGPGRDYDQGGRGGWGRGSDYGYGSGGYGRDYGYGGRSRGGYGRDYGYGSQRRAYGRYGEGDYGRGGYGREGYGGSGSGRDRDYGYGREGSRGEEHGFFERAADEVASWFGDEEAARRRQMDYRGRGPKGYTRSDERIRDDVNDRLTDDWSLDASEIEVSVSSGEVTLSGIVNSRTDKRRAEDIAESVSGVRHVQNNLRVRQSTTGAAVSGAEAGVATARPGLVHTQGSPDQFVTGSTTRDAAKTDEGDVPGPGLGSV
jgi:osmotically-inducible protein OsmY